MGKLIPLGIIQKEIHGIFLSTSPLTPEGKDYFDQVKEMGIVCFTGEELFEKIIEALNLPTKIQVFNKVKSLKYTPLMDYLLTTSYGYNRVVIASINTSLNPSHFFVFTQDFNLIDDINLLKQYQSNINILSALEPVYSQVILTNKKEYRIIQEGLLLGKDWFSCRVG